MCVEDPALRFAQGGELSRTTKGGGEGFTLKGLVLKSLI